MGGVIPNEPILIIASSNEDRTRQDLHRAVGSLEAHFESSGENITGWPAGGKRITIFRDLMYWWA